MSAVWGLVAGWLLLSGIGSFALMGFDKHRAGGAGRRVPERIFFVLAFAGGAFGILAGSGAFHHKRRKGSFMAVVFVSAFLWLAGLAELARLAGFP